MTSQKIICFSTPPVDAKFRLSKLLILCLSITIMAPLWASSCDDIIDRYNEAVQSNFPDYGIQLLTECTNSCESQRSLCSALSAGKQATGRALIYNMLQTAKSLAKTRPAAALSELRKIVKLGAINPVANAASISDAQQLIEMVEPVVRSRIDALTSQFDERLAANDYDAVRDILFELRETYPDSSAASALPKRALEQYEKFITDEVIKSDKLLDEMMLQARESKGRPSQHLRARSQKIANDISSFIANGLTHYPGNTNLIKLYNRAKFSEREIKDRHNMRVEFKEPDPINKETPENILVKAREDLVKGNFPAVSDSVKRVTQSLNGQRRVKADAYVLNGLAHAVQINSNNPNSRESKTRKLLAKTEFDKAKQIAPDVTLPKGYEQYATLFAEAKFG